MPQVFAAMIVHLYLPAGEAYTTDDHAAVALWLPPGSAAPVTAEVLRLATAAPLSPLAGRALWRASGLARFLDACRPEEPHYDLALLGTDPRRQGHGDPHTAPPSSQLTRCDAEGRPAYLETSNRRNLALYACHGFEVTKEVRWRRNGPLTSLLWREPKR